MDGIEHAIEGRRFVFSPSVTFTPFAAAQPCSARCWFCSETLRPTGTGVLAASLRPRASWYDGLTRALAALRGLRVGISISGLEATDDPVWLERVLDRLAAHEAVSPVNEKVLYSNGNGLAEETAGARLLPALARYGIGRIEISRHHDDAGKNQTIMRFRPGVAIASTETFERTLSAVSSVTHVRLVCIVQRDGIASPADVLRYLGWARARGVRDVVFRELSRVPSGYERTRQLRLVDERRVAIEPLLDAARAHPSFEARERTKGYYYWNERLSFDGDTVVTFETSDYEIMKKRHRSDVVHKLVFHGNGRLCRDWDPSSGVLLDTADAA